MHCFDISSGKEDVIILDSSNIKKFSVHLVFPKVIFKDNQSCKDFVLSFLDALSPSDKVIFNVFDSHNELGSMIDKGVYNRNQNFCIMLSSKFGKITPLLLSKENVYKWENLRDLFLDSLVSVRGYPVNTEQIASKFPHEIFPVVNLESELDDHSAPEMNDSKLDDHRAPDECPPEMTRTVDHLKHILVNELGCGEDRKVKFFANRNTGKSMLVFDFYNLKFCKNIGRNHSRNNVYFVFCCAKLVFYQKCYKCLGYRSQDICITLNFPI